MAISHEQFVKLVKSRQGSSSLRVYAKTLGVTAGYLSDVYLGKRDAGPSLAKVMGYERERKTSVCFRKKAA